MSAVLPIPETIRRRHRRRAPLTVAEWAERFRLLTDGPIVGAAGSVPWTCDTFPPGRAILEAASSGRWRRIVLLAAPQSSGKTAHAINVLLWALHWRNQDVGYVHANAAKAEAQYAKKIGPAIERQPTLRELVPLSRDEIGTKEDHRFTNGCHFFVTGSESVADLSGWTAPVLFFDDVHAMPPSIGAVGHPVEFAEKRAAAFPPHERISLCAGQATDTKAWLWRALLNSSFYCLHLPCLKCGAYQIVDWDRMQYDRQNAETARADCWLRCARPACTHRIRHEELPEMLGRYAWVSTPPNCNPVLRPEEAACYEPDWTPIGKRGSPPAVYPEAARSSQDAGFWWNAFTWPLVPWTAHAADAASAENDPDSRQTFRQQARVIPVEEIRLDADALEPADILAHRTKTHRWRTVPAEAGVHAGEGVVVVTADVQAGYIWYLVLAWNLKTGSSWVIECGRAGTAVRALDLPDEAARHEAWKGRVLKALDLLWTKAQEGWPILKPDGEEIGIARPGRGLIDCRFLREIVQAWCRLRNGGSWTGTWLPVQGSQCRASGIVPVWPGLQRATIEKKTRRRYWDCNVNRAKLYIRDLLAIPAGEPAGVTLPDDMPDWPRQELAAQLCSEEWDDGSGVWRKISKANHLLDALALQVCGAICSGARGPWAEAAPTKPVVVTNWFASQKRVRR